MAKMIDELWPVFLAEVTEQLDTLEFALIKITDLQRVDIDQLFRLFHTIKSSCAMLDFKHMEEVAHTSEDLLDLARKGKLQLSEKTIDALLEAVDALKKQLAEAEKNQASPGPRPAIVALLKGLSDSAAVPSTARNKTLYQEHAFHVVEEEFDQLQVLLQSSLDKALFSFLSDKSAEQKSHLIKLRNFFDLMGLAVVKNLVKNAITLTESPQGFDSIKHADLVAVILEKIEYLEKASSRDLSVSRARYLALQQHGLYLQELLTTLAVDIAAAIADVEARAAGEFPEKLFSRIQQARHLANLTGYQSLALLLGYLCQVLKSTYYEQEELLPDRESLANAIHFLRDINLSTLNEKDNSFIDRLIQKTHYSDETAAGLSATDTALASVVDARLLNAALWKKYLKSTEIKKLNEFYNKGWFVFEIYADLESNAEFSERFIDWLYENTTVITNVHVDNDALLKLAVNAGLAFIAVIENRDSADWLSEKLNENSGFLQYSRIQQNDEQKNQGANGDIDLSVAQGSADATSSDVSVTATLRIDSKTLDRFVSLVGEMVTRRNMLSYIINDEAFTLALKSLDDVAGHIANHYPVEAAKLLQTGVELAGMHNRLHHADVSVQQVSNRIQEEVMELRVVPIAMVFNRLPKMVRRLSRELNKTVSLQMSGESVKIDKGLVDLLMEPMSHLVRNAVDHGVEDEAERLSKNKNRSAVIQINAINKGKLLRIEIKDDGRGLPKGKILAKAFTKGIEVSDTASDEEIFNLIFLPGFSTSEVITEISGRGVGMDAVREKIKSVGGRVTVSSVAGRGTQFVLELPLSAAIQGVLVVASHTQKYAIAERSVVEILDINPADIQSVSNQSAYMLRGKLLPLYELDKLLYFDHKDHELGDLLAVVVISDGENQIGLAVKSVIGRHEIYVKEVNQQLLNLPGFGGASILGDGSVVIILDGDKLVKLAEKNPQPLSLLQKVGQDHIGTSTLI